MSSIDRISLDFFKEGFIPGMTVNVKVTDSQKTLVFKRAVIKEIHPFVVLTDMGCFQWKELYIWNKGRISAE